MENAKIDKRRAKTFYQVGPWHQSRAVIGQVSKHSLS